MTFSIESLQETEGRVAGHMSMLAKAIALAAVLMLCAILSLGCASSGNGPSGASSSQDTQATQSEAEMDEGIKDEANSLADASPALHVEGTNLVDASDEPFQLRGISTHGLAWFPEYVNSAAFQTLRDEWGVNCIRLALYTHEYNGYCTGGDKAALRQLVEDGVAEATGLGMYSIIDWHVLNEQTPLAYKDEAIRFFDEMSAKYVGNPRVIYEICNEPNGGATWDDVRSYAADVIPVIRANAPDSVIVVGTPTWSQDVDKAASAPLPYENIVYALHFYADTHTQWLRDRAKAALDAGLPILVSEFGMCDASGSGANNFTEAQAWLDFLDANNVGYIAWNLSNKDETSALLAPGTQATSGWSDVELSDSGLWIKQQYAARGAQ